MSNPHQVRAVWQTTFVDLMALLLCFLVLQFAMRLPQPAAGQVSPKLKLPPAAATTWLAARLPRGIVIGPDGPRAVRLTQSAPEHVPALVQTLGALGCAVVALDPVGGDSAAPWTAFALDRAFTSRALSVPHTAGQDSRVTELTLRIDLARCT